MAAERSAPFFQSSEIGLSEILAATDDAVIATDAEGFIRFCNGAAERLYRVQRLSVMGKPTAVLYTEVFFSTEDEQRSQSDLRQRGSWKGESKHVRSDGTELFVSSTVNELGAGGGMVSIIRDVSQQKRAEMETQNRVQELARANDDLLHFAYAAGHDLRAPLRTVSSFSQLLALKYKAKLDQQGGDFIQWIVDAGARMETMLEDLLEFAKVAGGEAASSEPVSLEAVVGAALESLRSVIEETEAVVSYDPLPTVACNGGQFAQLFENLIGNSIKYQRKSVLPQIHISAEERKTEWVLRVRDNGIGFKPEYAERIFGVFQRLHKNEFAGTGIGLSICKRVVERRGGKIWATAEPEQGAVFYFSIPFEQPVTPLRGESPQMEYLRQRKGSPDEDYSTLHLNELFHTLALVQAVVRDLDGNVLIWTQGSQQLFGWTEAEALGKRLHELIGTESVKPLSEIEAALLRQGEWTGELKARKRDGTVVWLASHQVLYRDGSGRPQSVIEVHNDISALKETEAALVRSSQQRDLALSAGQMGVWRWDMRAGTVEWSETLEAFLGMAPGSFQGTMGAFESLLHPDDHEPLQARIAETFQRGSDYSIEQRLRRSDGTYCWVRGQGRVQFDENRQPNGLIGLVWDISETKQREADNQFELEMGKQLTGCATPTELADIATAALAEYLQVSRCLYSETDPAAGLIHILADHCPGGRSAKGSLALDQFNEINAEMARNRVVAVNDVKTDARTAKTAETAYLAHGTRAFLSVPLHRDGVWVANLSVADREVRVWQAREMELLRGVAERLWPAMENARLLQDARERQEQFESTFEQVAMGMSHVAMDGRLLLVNERLCEITGYTREELMQLRFRDITHPDDLNDSLNLYESLKSGENGVYAQEKRYIHKSGSVVWANLTVSLVRESNGVPKYAIAVIEEIGDRKRTAHALQETKDLAELRLREIESIYAQAPVGLMSLDRDLRYTKINDYLAKMNGLPASDHIGRTVAQMLPALRDWILPHLRSVMETGTPLIEAEFRAETDTTWLLSFFPLLGPDGTMVGINGVVQDITERRHTQEAWLKATERLRLASASAQLGLVVWDIRQGRTYWENQYMYEVFGRPLEMGPLSIQELLDDYLVPEDRKAVEAAMEEAMIPGRVFRPTYRIRRKDGSVRWVRNSGLVDHDAGGKPIRMTIVAADITEQKETELSLLEQKQHLKNVLDSLFVFVGVVSLDGVLLEANRPPLAAAGIAPDEVIGKYLPDTYWWSYELETQNRIRKAMDRAREGESSRFDIEARMKEGELVTLDFMMAPLRDEMAQVRYLIASAVPIEERKRAEEALRKSEERYVLSEWATNDGLWDWDLMTGECYFSAGFKAMLGFAEHEMKNSPEAAFERMHPDDAPILFDTLRAHLEMDKPYDVEIRLQLKDGAYRWFRSRGRSVRGNDGKVIRMVGSMGDIHDRKEAEALRWQHDEQLRRMIDSISQLAWMANADGYIFWYNRRWYEYTGTTPDQMEGWGWQKVHDPKRLPEVMRVWLESIRTGRPFEMEFPLLGADGVYRPFLTRIMPVHDSQGSVVKWFGTNTNVEALRREQDMLRESERQFRELAERLPEMVWAADPHGLITYWNPQLYAYSGYARDAGFADKWVSLLHPDDVERIAAQWQNAVTTGQPYQHEGRMRRHDGAYRWFLHRAEPVRDEQGRIVKWLGTSTDIHEQKLTEQALRRSNEGLEQFAYAASHDLQEPLRTVTIYSQLLAKRYGGLGEEAERFTGFISNGTKRMECLLKGILEYSRMGDVVEGPASCSSEEVLKTAVSSLKRSMAESGVQVSHDTLPQVACPESHLALVFEHLIANSIKYRAERPLQIRVTAAREGAMYRFAVTDNGIGFKAEYAAQIFGMFKRLHRDEYPGVGVGLAVCKRIIERHGGQIWAESEPGAGTTVFFTLGESGRGVAGEPGTGVDRLTFL